MIIAVNSASSTLCTITGYPKITFIQGTRPIPFTYLDGKGQYVTHQEPFAVTVGSGKMAYFLVAKYRCDVGLAERADGANVLLSRQGTVYSVPDAWLRGAVNLCSGEKISDPGNTITVSPFEPSASLVSG